MTIILIITFIHKASFLTGAHSALQLLIAFIITKYRSATDTCKQAGNTVYIYICVCVCVCVSLQCDFCIYWLLWHSLTGQTCMSGKADQTLTGDVTNVTGFLTALVEHLLDQTFNIN